MIGPGRAIKGHWFLRTGPVDSNKTRQNQARKKVNGWVKPNPVSSDIKPIINEIRKILIPENNSDYLLSIAADGNISTAF